MYSGMRCGNRIVGDEEQMARAVEMAVRKHLRTLGHVKQPRFTV